MKNDYSYIKTTNISSTQTTVKVVLSTLNEHIKTRTFNRISRGGQTPENELEHDVFTVQGQKSPEEAQRYHAELSHTDKDAS